MTAMQHFTSYERDGETGTDYAVNRHYNQGTGRFQSADPSQASGAAGEPQSWNRYAYVGNAPADWVDPQGLLRFAPPPPDPCHSDSGGRRDCVEGNCTEPIDMDPPERTLKRCTSEDGNYTPDGFPTDIGVYAVSSLNAALQTVIGELTPQFNIWSRAEAEAIASTIFNRATALANGTAPRVWGRDASLFSVVTAPGQYAGFPAGGNILRAWDDNNREFAQGGRACNLLQTAGGAINWLAHNSSARGPWVYMCRYNHVGRAFDPGTDVRINDNVFSTRPLTCH